MIIETIIERKQTSFRLRSDLIKRLQVAASEQNRSLNNFVESVLMDVVSMKPNATTIAAMEEVKSGKELETLDVDKLDDLVASL